MTEPRKNRRSDSNRSRGHGPKLEFLRIRNYRALQDFELDGLTPLTVFLGPNGSGKSTILDALAFLAECFTSGLPEALRKRGGFAELRSRGKKGSVAFEIGHRSSSKAPLVLYKLEIDEKNGSPCVVRESIESGRNGRPLLEFRMGKGTIHRSGGRQGRSRNEELDSSESLAIGAFGRLKAYPEAFFLRRFITSWQFPHFSADSARSPVEAESHDRLSESGENLVNVIRGLREAKSPELTAIVSKLSRWAPRFQKLMIRKRNDGQLVLRLKDEQFADPILSKFISDGTLQLLYYLVLFAAPKSSPLIGVEEPENHLHPRLLRELAEEFRKASARMQLFVTTHSPYFASGMRPDEVWVVHRDAGGYSRARRTCDMQGIPEFLDEGALLGDLWMENHFAVGDPLAAASASGRRSGSPPRRRGKR